MPRLRRRTTRRRTSVEVSDMAFAYLSDDPDFEAQGAGGGILILDLMYPTAGPRMDALKRMWGAVRAEVLETWTAKHPGSRPRAWWLVDAPADEYRRRLGGRGTPVFECLNYAPHFAFGIPDTFMDADTLAFYVDHGKNGGLENREHPGEPVEAFDPNDPPKYESQARYLWDRGLLEPAEKKAVEKAGSLGAVETVEQEPEIKIMRDGRLLETDNE